MPYMQKEVLFRNFITQPRKYFQSQIVVEFERSPAKLVQPIEKLTNLISKQLLETYWLEIPVDFMRLDFDYDRTKNYAPHLVQKIVIERRAGVPFDKEQYYRQLH